MLQRIQKLASSKWTTWVALGLIVLLGLVARLYKIDTPLADWHSWRQADTASVTREFVKNEYPIWQPHFHDLSNIPSGIENLEGHRMVEFPLPNYAIAQTLKSQPNLDLVVASRVASALVSLITIFALFSLTLRTSKSLLLASITSGLYATLPFAVFYSRVILPEPYLIAFGLLSLVFFVQWIDSKKTFYSSSSFWSSIIFLALALLMKPVAVFLGPVYLALAVQKLGWKKTLVRWELLFFALAFIPLVIWRWHVSQFPEGIPAAAWLLNGNGIRLRPAWWRWLFGDRIGQLILGYWGTAFAVLGLVIKSSKKMSAHTVLTISMVSSAFLYLVVIATGNVQHDYYQAFILPALCLLVGRGIWIGLQPKQFQLQTWIAPVVTLVAVGLMYFFSWYYVRGYYNINNPAIVEAGTFVDANTPENAIVIAPYQGDTAFLFQTNRTGWPIGGLIDQRIANEAEYYITTALDDEAKSLMEQYQVIEQNERFTLIKLSTE